MTSPSPTRSEPPAVYQPSDFTYDAEARTCVCPAGKSLYRSRPAITTNRDYHLPMRFHGEETRLRPLRASRAVPPHAGDDRDPLMSRSSRARRAPLPRDTHGPHERRASTRRTGATQYSANASATVEPVFGNLCYNKGLTRFTLRGRTKVDGQWKLFCLVHNIEKLARTGYAK